MTRGRAIGTRPVLALVILLAAIAGSLLLASPPASGGEGSRSAATTTANNAYDAATTLALVTVADAGRSSAVASAVVAPSGRLFASSGELSAPRWADDALAACRTNSFVPGTLVLMADGTTKAIEDVDIGDWVWATEPESGDAGPKRVTDTIVGDGTKQLVDIEVDGATITATDGHPFWVDDQGAWIDADDLAPGDLLVLADGTTVDVDAVAERSGVLTVDGVHTYHVMAGDDPVLVHNCSVGLRSTPSGLKTHGELPSRDALRRATGDELDHLADVLRESIDTRQTQMLDPRFMNDITRRTHALRLEEERQLLRFIEAQR